MVRSTVVIPNFNGILYIENCLNSLYQSTSQDFEVIVVDNASSDESAQIVKQKFPKVMLIQNDENLGFSAAVNQGILASKTEFVILLNNDTCVEKNFILELEQAMDQDKRLFSAGAKMISLHEPDKLDDAGDFYCALGWAYARGKGKNPNLYQKADRIFSACAGAAIYRRSIFDQIGLFDEAHFAYFEDIDVGYRARISGFQNVFAPKAIVYHAGSATSGSRYNAFKTKLASRNSIYLIYKNMPVLQILLNFPFLLLGFLVKTLFFMKKGFGKIYVNGLLEGIKLSFSKEAKQWKVKTTKDNFRYLVQIQIELWFNFIGLICR